MTAALFAATAGAPGGRADTKPEGRQESPIVAGARVFHAKGCDGCHAVSGTPGKTSLGPDLVGQTSWQDVMQLSGSLWNHAPRMLVVMREQGVERPNVSSEEMEQLLEYLFYRGFLDEPGDPERGRQLFASRSCARCHQFGGRGGTVGPRLDELAPHASSLFLAQALWNHGPRMAREMKSLDIEWPRLEGDDLANIVAFMRGTEQPPVSFERLAAECGSPRSGQVLFERRGCLGCHRIGDRGGAIGPDLDGRRRWRNLADLAGTLWNHAPSMWAKMKERGSPYRELSEREMADILAYLYLVQYTAEGGDAARGERVFREKACADCHRAGATGAATGSDLTGSEALRSAVHWATALWQHPPDTAEQLRGRGIAWPLFEGDDMRDLVAFVRSQRGNR